MLLTFKWFPVVFVLQRFVVYETAIGDGLGLPIGAIFHDSDEDIRRAFSYQVNECNRRQSNFKLIPHIATLNIDDSYLVGSKMCQLISHGILTLYTSHSVSTLTTIRSYSAAFQVPFLTSNMAINVSRGQLDTGLELYLRPHYARAVVDIIRHYGWKDVCFLYSTDEGLERLQQLLDVMTDTGLVVRQLVYRVADGRDADWTIRRLQNRGGAAASLDDVDDAKHIIVDLPTKHCEEFLRLQGIQDMDQTIFANGGINATGFRIVEPTNVTVRNFISSSSWMQLSGNRHISHDAALAVDAVTVIFDAINNMSSKQLSNIKHAIRSGKQLENGSEGFDCESEPVTPWRHGHELIYVMKQLNFAGLTGTVRFDKFGLRTHYKLDVMEASLNHDLTRVGTWQFDKGLFIQPPILRPPKHNGAAINRTLVITSILVPPYLTRRQDSVNGPERTGNDIYEGYCADLARMIAEQVGFAYVIEPVADNKYGKKENGTWNGMVGELVRKKADMAIAPLTITANREKVIYFSKPFMSLGISIMIKKPTKETPGVFSFMNPLSYEIWMCILFAYIGVSVVLFLVSRFSPYEWHIEDHTDGPTISNNFTIFNSLWFTIGAFMQQGCDIEPRSVSGRIVGSVWWFFTLIIISSYTANLAAFLTVERMQSPIESAEDLAKQTEIKYGTIDSGSTREFFEASTIPVYERMWAFMSTTGRAAFVSSIKEGVDRVRQGKYAFLIESTTNDYYNQKKPCDTMKVGANLDSKGYGIATPLVSDLRDRITLAVLELSEKEELAHLERTWWYDKGECGPDRTYKKQEVTSSLKLSHVAGLFYILLCGIGFAALTATGEFLYKTWVEAVYRKDATHPPTAHLVNLDAFGDLDIQTQV